jgi:tetratricopeptide (TPR) repeat protein
MASLELSMIVKNGEATLARCLESVRSIVDTIVIADTGSTDSTVQIARRYGARVINVPWQDDFSKARNAALSHGDCDWVLSLDDDELLDAEGAASIAPLLTTSQVLGYDVRIWNYTQTLTSRMLKSSSNPNPHRVSAAEAFPAYVEHVNVRLFRRHPQIFFEGRVHEGVADRMKRMGQNVAPAEFIIHHLGMAEDCAEQRMHKMEYYRDLGRKKLDDAPNDFRAHCELGLNELENFHSPGSALPHFLKAIELKPDSAMLWTYAGICGIRLGKLQEGLLALQRAEQFGARDAVHLEAMGDAHYHLGHVGVAKCSYEAAEAAGSHSGVLQSKLGVCEVRLGFAETGLRRIQAAVEREPNFGELYDILVAAALLAGDRELAAETAELRLRVGNPSADKFLLTAAIHVQLGDLQRAAEVLRDGCERFPEDTKLRSAMSEVDQKIKQA